MDATVLLQQVVNGLSIGLVYALMAIGFTLIFGVLNVVNFAHGEVYTVGAFIGLIVITALSPPLWLVLGLVLLGGGLAGVVLERLAFRPFRRFRDEAALKSKAMREATLLSSLAVSIIVREALELKFSGEMQTIAQAYLLQSPIQLGPITITDGNLIIFALSAAMLGALQFVLYRTRIGLSIRAVSNNVLGAQFVGIDTTRAIVATFVVGSMLGAVAGIMVGLYQGAIFPNMGFEPGVKAFVAMVMGGLSSIPGAVVCALILGVSESVATQFFSDGWKALVSYGFLLATLWFFPSGIFGFKKEKMKGRLNALLVAALVLLLAGLVAWKSSYFNQIAITTMIFVILAASLNLITGSAGLLSLGHAAFFGVGAYAAALLSTKLGWPFWLTVPAAGAAAAAVGALVAVPTMRLTSIYFAVATLGIGEMIYVTMLNWVGFTRGPMGIRSIPGLKLFGFEGMVVSLIVVAALMLATLWLVHRLVHSYYGNAMRALREDDACADAMGIDVARLKLQAFSVACALAGVAGALFAHTTGYISPESFKFGESILVLSMIVVGGLGSLYGSIIGAVILSVLPELLRDLGQWRMIAVGVVLFMSILFLPRGLVGEVSAIDLIRRQLRRGERDPATDAASTSTPAQRSAW